MSHTSPGAAALEQRLRRTGVVPVITIEKASDAVALGDALAAGGLPVAEVTFRTAAAAEAIAVLRAAHPDFLIGAGTVLTVSTVEEAVDAGADFVVAPGFNPAVVDRCLAVGMAIVPGTSTPSDIEAGLHRGLRLLKFFPAEAVGGLRFLSAVSAPYPSVSFMPTGGIDRHNLGTYLARPQVAACGGSWIATTTDITSHRFTDITDRAREAVALAAPFTAAVPSSPIPSADPTTEMSSR